RTPTAPARSENDPVIWDRLGGLALSALWLWDSPTRSFENLTRLFMKKLLLPAFILPVYLATSLEADTVLVFNEIMYHPATNEPALEWVELKNQMAVDVDISGWSIAGGIQYTFPSNSIVRGGAFLVVAISPPTLM